MSAPLYRLIVRASGESRGRAYAGLVRDGAGNVVGIRRQRPGLGSVQLYARADGLALARELERLTGATVTLRMESAA